MEIVERPREASHVTQMPVKQGFFEQPTRFKIPPYGTEGEQRLVPCGVYDVRRNFIANIAGRMYEKGVKAGQQFLANNPIRYDKFLPQLNYTAPALNQL